MQFSLQHVLTKIKDLEECQRGEEAIGKESREAVVREIELG